MAEPRFLVVRLGSLGDIVHTVPAVAALRESFPSAQVVWLTHPRWKFLVETSGLASEICTVETRSMQSLHAALGYLRQNRWHAAIDYQGLWKSAMLPFFGYVPRRIGFSSRTVREFGVPLLYTDRVDARKPHVAEQNGELSLRAGAKRATAPVCLQVPAVDVSAIHVYLREQQLDRYVVLSPGGGWRSKCWPPERFGALAKLLRDSLGLRCVVNIGPGDEDLASPLLDGAGGSAPQIYTGTLGQLMALLRGAASIVAGDTGPLHLAAALGTPTVALFGPTDPARNGPFRGPVESQAEAPRDVVLRIAGARASHKRRSQPDPSMLALTVESVFDAVRLCLGGSG